ncbi:MULTISPECIES: sensor histidine kinase [Nonomuraea]|uniref:histidine kinase n=1 Tax=Nonomuraea ferruginea TaxID=46174 RepID=A0ABT4SVV4_9ACTN|nr:sensor histidine kinase [Nonomuraea ferruginea]MDA0641190.1 sensor histidine kinase [Nonomuraea ferruginea]
MQEPPLVTVLRRRARALPPLLVDGALALLVTGAQLWPLLTTRQYEGLPWHWWGYVVAVASSLPLVWRRRAPLAVLIVSLTTSLLYDLAAPVAEQPVWYGQLVAYYTVAALSSRPIRMLLLACTVVGSFFLPGSPDTALRSGILLVAAYAMGRAAAGSRAQAAALEERAARLERERQLEAQRAAERERARIAREMHDILAHAVSLMVVQAEAGPVAVRKDPARAEAAFDAIAGAGRDAMEQIRRMLGVLKEDGGAPRAPQPTVDDLPELAAQVSGAGLEVTFEVAGEPRPVTAASAVAAYRIVQEALTNIVKHAGATRAGIRLTWEDDTLMIDVTDDGRGAGRALPSGGHGLIGIRERATACGGTATAGPRTDAPGFHVSARLPLS